MESAPKESRDILPDELWSIVLVGHADVDDFGDCGDGVEPRWRFAARLVCRTWCAIIDKAKPSLWGTLHIAAARMWLPHRLMAWGRGRVVCASALADWATRRTHTMDWNDHGNVDRFCQWVAQCASDGAQSLATDMAIVLAATGVPALVHIALEYTIVPDTLSRGRIHSGVAVTHAVVDDMITDDAFANPSLDVVYQTPPVWRHTRHVSPQRHLASLVAEAVVKNGSRDAIDIVLRSAPWAMTMSLVVRAAALNDDVTTVDALFALADPPLLHVLGAIKGLSGPRVITYCLDAAQNPKGRPWAVQFRDWLLDSDNRAWLVEDAIAADNGRALALYDARLSYWDGESGSITAARVRPAIDTDKAIKLVCRQRAIDCAHWLWERAQRGGRDEEMRVLAALTKGACRLSADDDDMPCSDDSDALLSWLCDGPPRYDPRDEGDFGRLDRLILATCTRFDVDPDSFAWLCERWPDDVAHTQPLWVAGIVRVACDRANSHPDGVYGIERMVAALEQVSARQGRDAADALVVAVDIWAFLFERFNRALSHPDVDDCEAVFATIQHVWSRCADDGDQRVTDRLAHERSMTLFCIDPRSYRPWRCTWADASVWRRWCRVRPMALHASPRDPAYRVWLTERGLIADQHGN
ncbi:hypothetical protein pmac_cds_166 [Pandoravirus macleodensis]|uniref:F-box incomplete domain containing protein n=1 Tax=Pandoravirus macleodensis TaxID=2107707 RepID=A0A2U7UEJ3_9VIRU|nr:hypothetical protein pmac_cds_166 [Pandoravirus macleodensis]AVK76854.1 hypothetical protein pmac_cds_166 [Pandoravirus macleodensis]UMO79443.1 hypothetical protein [Pandoravirus aubagnensis]